MDPGEDSVEDDADVRPPTPRTSTPKKRRRALPIAAVAIVLAVAVVLVLVFSSSKKPAYTAFVDHKAGFRLSYPSSWTAQTSNDANVALQLNFGANGNDTLLVRVVPLAQTVNLNNEADIKAVTDAIISGTPVTVVQQNAVKVNRLLGYYYLYTLPVDPSTGLTLVHAHFFVFVPHEMVALVFQTTRADYIGAQAAINKVVSTFQAST